MTTGLLNLEASINAEELGILLETVGVAESGNHSLQTLSHSERRSSLLPVVKLMRFLILMTFMHLGLPTTEAAAVQTNGVAAPKVAIRELLAHKADYKGKRVEVTGYYAGFFEHYGLRENKDSVSSTNKLWIDPFREEPGYRQNIKGDRTDFTGKVRIIGVFDYRPGYGMGHLGQWPAGITKLELFERTD